MFPSDRCQVRFGQVNILSINLHKAVSWLYFVVMEEEEEEEDLRISVCYLLVTLLAKASVVRRFFPFSFDAYIRTCVMCAGFDVHADSDSTIINKMRSLICWLGIVGL